jgi:hypothetical protein
MTQITIYAHASWKPIRTHKVIDAPTTVLRIIRHYRRLGMKMVYYSEDSAGNTTMHFVER